MRSTLSIIDIATSAIRSLKIGMDTMYQFQLTKFPEITVEEIFLPRVVSSDRDFAALILLRHELSMSTGFVTLLIPKELAAKLLQSSGLSEVTDQDISDSCGELCNLIAGHFKNELSAFVEGDITISTPKLFVQGAFEPIEGVNVDQKYIMKVKKRGMEVMQLHLAFQSIK